MANYNSTHSGTTIDDTISNAPTKTGGGANGIWPISISGNAETATTAINATNATNATNDENGDNIATSLSNHNSRISALETRVFSRARYQGSGDTSFSSWITFNTIEQNVGGGTWSNGQYYVPSAGVYLANFTCYSNSMTSGRVAVARLNSSGSSQEMNMVNQNQSTSITGIFQCNEGDRLVAGSYASNYSISIYAAAGHNEFTIFKLL